MNIVVASSRGHGLKPLQGRGDTLVFPISGGRLASLSKLAVDRVKRQHQDQIWVYFVAGLPNITDMKKKGTSTCMDIGTTKR